MYHSINYEKNNPLRVPKAKFAAEMKWLYTNGYHTLSLDELYNAISKGKSVPEKSVVLTFDDGYSDNYRSAFPIIKQYHFKATVFMITSKIDKFLYLKSDQLKEMDRNGFSVESHTVTHPHLDSLSYKQQYKELTDSKAKLAALLGHSVDYMAYPYGNFNSSAIAAAKKAGYKLCFRMKGGMGTLNDNHYEFPRAYVGENLKDFISRVKGTANYSM
jgi:peptidoglycan/xylan/chitin deacetylase (PgdA/CDA1 family)